MITQEKRTKMVKNLINRHKFLYDSKYFKNNNISMAAWDSWAAQGQAGSCDSCGVGHYNCGLINKRAKNDDFCKICSSCCDELENQLNYKFNRF